MEDHELIPVATVACSFGITEAQCVAEIKRLGDCIGIKLLHLVGGRPYTSREVLVAVVETRKDFESLVILSPVPLSSVPIAPDNYVYFLCEGKDVVYVGQSVELLARLAQHRRDKSFDGVALHVTERADLDLIENINIHYHHPKFNKAKWSAEEYFAAVLRATNLDL